jgi:hypothetical protein
MTPTPAAAPSANLGAQAHASGQVKQALIMLETALPHIGIETPLHKAVMTSITNLAKHLGHTSAGPGQDRALNQSMLRDLALRSQQMSPMLAAMSARGGAAGQPGAGAPPSPPPAMPESPGA